MHPNAADPGIAAIVHDPFCSIRSRDDHHSVDPARDRDNTKHAAFRGAGNCWPDILAVAS